MTTPRRRLVRSASSISSPHPPDPRLPKLRSRLEEERNALARWMRRLRRAFHAVEKQQLLVARLEKQIARMEE